MRFKIATKIILAFGVITLAVIINALMTSSALQKSREVNDKISNLYTPSLAYINDLYSKIGDSRMLVKSWVFIDKISDTPDKLKLRKLHAVDYKMVMDTLKTFSEIWSNEHSELRDLLLKIDSAIVDTLFVKHQYIMDQLSDFESYDDPFIIFEITPMTEEGGEVMLLTQRILNQIGALRTSLESQVENGRIEMVDTFNSFKTRIIIMAIVLVLGALIIGAFTIDSLARPINHTKNILLKMSQGILPKEKLTEGSDEIGQMAKALNLLIQGLKDIFNFSLEIGKGNFDTEFKPLSEDDVLGLSLLEMRNELKNASNEEEKRKEEDKQRNWAAQGVAMFSDILRKSSDNLEELSYDIISNMVKYTNSNQGGMFIVNDSDKDHIGLEMAACYAYDRKKFLQKKVEIGEGLVGRCYQEHEKIFLTEIPNDYMKITSGLGDDNPRCLLLIPLVYSNVIYGIIEIASFNVYRPFEIEFIERISESIAATISSVKANIQTSMLLEQSQQQAEEMAAQEEEMRQNMEELRATQEQSARREEDLKKEVEELRKRLKELSEQ
ncbi:MAG TPA: GAF domain-containing protein [Bacteroidales bacterium]|nr:GAF domain-containing protein [Bacteroidales bacterium]